jgi:hypothetical protein
MFSTRISLACAVAMALGMPLHAADIGSDLRATILLQGLPCDAVTQKTRVADSNYNVTCKDGNHYHVFIDAQGRVVVEKK